jgi:hypothetical protein
MRCWKSTADICQLFGFHGNWSRDKVWAVIMEIKLMFINTACRLTKLSWICTKILSRNLLLLYCNVVIRNLKIMPLIWKYYCGYNNVSHNVNIICTKTIVPDHNAYKSNCRTKVSCTLDKIYVLATDIVLSSRQIERVFCVMNSRSPLSLI